MLFVTISVPFSLSSIVNLSNYVNLSVSATWEHTVMMDFRKAMGNNRVMKALSGLSPVEFNALALQFKINVAPVFHKIRKVNAGLGKDFSISMDEMLFFILFYVKCYPTFDVAGYFFDVNRSTCCRWSNWFMSVLETSLGKEVVLPKRRIKSVDEFYEIFPDINDILIDGTERIRRRPSDSILQKRYYSGKKKRHTIKNLIVCDRKKRIGVLTKTVEGKQHDYNILKKGKMPDNIPDHVRVWLDNGFQGVKKKYPHLKVRMPKKKPKGGELTAAQKERNKTISRRRITVEHAIGGVKRFGIVHDVFRNVRKGFDDKVMLVCAGLWNYHLKLA
jgi:hypothetical protein